MAKLSYCAEHVRRFDNDRFICSLFAPVAEREALAAVYAYNIEVARIRELVNEPLLGHMRLQWWREALDQIYDGRAPRHQVALAVAETVGRFAVNRRHLERILDARAFDLEDEAPQTLDELIDYAEATSATLTELSLEILGGANDAARQAARGVGIAWALIGIVRAVPFHAQSRRLYLPEKLIRDAGLSVSQLFERGATPGLSNVVATVAERAEEFLRSARDHRRQVPKQALPALLPATLAEVYLKRIAASGFDPFDNRVQKTGPSRLLRIAYSRIRNCY